MGRSNPTPTLFLEKSEVRQEQLKGVVKVGKDAKEKAMQQATQPLGFCLIITVFILTLVIAPPLAIVLL